VVVSCQSGVSSCSICSICDSLCYGLFNCIIVYTSTFSRFVITGCVLQFVPSNENR